MKIIFGLLIVTCGITVAITAPGNQEETNGLASVQQNSECDDPCLLCDLYNIVNEYILEDMQYPSTGQRNDQSTDQRYMQSQANRQRYDQATGQRYLQATGQRYRQATGQRYLQATGQRYQQATGQRYLQATGQRYRQATGQRNAGTQSNDQNNAQTMTETVQEQSNTLLNKLMNIMSSAHSEHGRKKRQDDGHQCLDICSLCSDRQEKRKKSTLKQAVINSILNSLAMEEYN